MLMCARVSYRVGKLFFYGYKLSPSVVCTGGGFMGKNGMDVRCTSIPLETRPHGGKWESKWWAAVF